MRSETLPKPTKELITSFRQEDLPSKSYLAGGTATALWIGHRQSQDLDWFSPNKFNEKSWQMKWESKWDFTLVSRDWQTLVGKIRNVKTALYFYHYPLIENPVLYYGLYVAGLKDLAAMKMDAILSRGTKRDFIDLYYLSKKFSADQLFAYYDQKYGGVREKELLLRKALMYFADADEDEMPKMLVPTDWKKVKEFFLKTFN